MADLQFATLLSMGYPADYIERAIDVHKKSKYGTDWNLSILVEIIGRLQEKDKELEFVPNIMMQPPPRNMLANNDRMGMQNIPPVMINNQMNMMNNAMNAMMNNNHQMNMGMLQNMQLPNAPHLQQSFSMEQKPEFQYLHRASSNIAGYDDGLSSDSDNEQIHSPIVQDVFSAHYMNINEPLKKCIFVNDIKLKRSFLFLFHKIY